MKKIFFAIGIGLLFPTLTFALGARGSCRASEPNCTPIVQQSRATKTIFINQPETARSATGMNWRRVKMLTNRGIDRNWRFLKKNEAVRVRMFRRLKNTNWVAGVLKARTPRKTYRAPRR